MSARRTRLFAALAAALFVSAGPSRSSAQRGALDPAAAPPAVPRGYTAWDYAREPGLRADERDVWRASGLVRRARLPGLFPRERAEDIGLASKLLEAVVARRPRMASAVLALARARELLGDHAGALVMYQRALELGGESAPERVGVLFTLGLIYTRLERFADARDAYERAVVLPAASHASWRPSVLANLGETYVSLGEIERAISAYLAATTLSSENENAVAWWGLASAYDRDGRGPESLRAAHRALGMDPYLLDVSGEGVFYAPAYEGHYYLALAREAQGRPVDALPEWQRYLDEGGARGLWAARARWHVAQLRALIARQNAVALPRPNRAP